MKQSALVSSVSMAETAYDEAIVDGEALIGWASQAIVNSLGLFSVVPAK